MFNEGKSLFSSKEMGKGYLMEGSLDKNLGSFGDYWNFNCESENFRDQEIEKTEKLPADIVDLLPSDPFGMDMAATVTTIAGWLEDLEMDFGLKALGLGTHDIEIKKRGDQLLPELNLIWKGAFEFYPQVVDVRTDGKSIGSAVDKELWDGLCGGSILFNSNIEDSIGFSNDKYGVSGAATKQHQGCTTVYSGGNGGTPPDALFFVFDYLGVSDLLSVERVCKTLFDAVRNDPLLWRSIRIDHPLSGRITDDTLLQLTSRAQGSLQSLSLVECLKLTDTGLKRVLETNPRITKLSVAGCVRLSVEGILCNLKEIFKSAGTPRIKNLRIGGLFGVTNKQFEEFKFLLGAGNHKPLSAHKPRFYRAGELYLSVDDDRAIDIETCPRCEKVKQVYDCPAESCQGKRCGAQLCRACTSCIARCINCGCCIDGRDYVETFGLDMLCLDCLKQFLNCQEEEEEMSTPLKQNIIHQQATYHFCDYG